MKPAQKESLRYGLLLILLLATGAIAVGVTINFMDSAVPDNADRLILTIAIWTLTLGFMLIAGAFGLWAVHFASEAEGLRRVSLLVDRMDFIRDSVIALDRQGRIMGMNAAATSLFGSVRQESLTTVCPGLPDPARDAFSKLDTVVERECRVDLPSGPHTLRFRYQPATEGMVLLLISDITALAATRARQRRSASIQLAGHLAQGIANDFNDLLCGISGHLSLLAKAHMPSADANASVEAIQDCANRGIRLARQLIQLSASEADPASSSTIEVARHVNVGLDLLASSLDSAWTIERDIQTSIPPVNLPPAQIEHLVHSLGLVVTETVSPDERKLGVRLHRLVASETKPVEGPIAALLEIVALPETTTLLERTMPEEGVVSSLAKTLLSQAGGHLDAFPSGRRTRHYRIFLPEADPSTTSHMEAPLAIGLEAYTVGWLALLCLPDSYPQTAPQYLQQKHVKTERVPDEGTLLAALTAPNTYDAVFLHAELLGPNTLTIARVIQRLSPQSAIIILSTTDPAELTRDFTYLPHDAPPPKWIHAMIDARSRLRDTPPSPGIASV